VTATPRIARHFDGMTDPRAERARRHKWQDVRVIALCAIIADADSRCEVADFGRAKADWLSGLLELKNGIPGHDTFNRAFSAIAPDHFQRSFTSWINAVCSRLCIKGYRIDGKAQRGGAERAAGLNCLHAVSVWCREAGLCVALEAVDAKSNEITAIPEKQDKSKGSLKGNRKRAERRPGPRSATSTMPGSAPCGRATAINSSSPRPLGNASRVTARNERHHSPVFFAPMRGSSCCFLT
jgi:hypothetical protein